MRRELRQLLEAECAAADLDVVTGLAHQHEQLAHPTTDHIAVKVRCGTPTWT